MTKVGCDSSVRSFMIVGSTMRTRRQARANSVRGDSPTPSTGGRLRAITVATLLALIFSLSPDLTQAPTLADEPGAATRVSQVVSPVLGVPQPLEPSLPPRRPASVVAAQPPATEATASEAMAQQFQSALDTARYAAGAYGVTFAAVRDGQVVWVGSSGVERDGRTLLTPESSMVIGSVTKTFVAATVLQLVDEGRLALDDAVRDYLPDVRQVSRKITIRQLLDHTSGLADVFNDETRRGLEEHPERTWSRSQVLSSLHAPWYQPGEGWAYANTNYFLLGMIVERITGSTLEDELAARFLGPLDLTGTRMLRPDDRSSPLPAAWTTIFWGSGNMVSSAGDLARWGDALYDDDVAGRQILSAETESAMLDIHREDYGLGVKRMKISPRTAYGHTGLLNTYTTLLLHFPGDDITIALLVNRTNVDLLHMLIERAPGGGKSLLRLAIDS